MLPLHPLFFLPRFRNGSFSIATRLLFGGGGLRLTECRVPDTSVLWRVFRELEERFCDWNWIHAREKTVDANLPHILRFLYKIKDAPSYCRVLFLA